MRVLNLDGHAAVEIDGLAFAVADASGGSFGPNPDDLFAQWDAFRRWRPPASASGCAIDRDRLGAPVLRPTQVFAVGVNYLDHAREVGLTAPEDLPMVFTKFQSAIGRPYGDLVLTGAQVDWEVELVVVIGREGTKVSVESAWDHVAGLTVGQDYSDRGVQFGGPAPQQFSLAKSFPGFAPLGPALITPDEPGMRDDLRLTCSVNGEIVQDGKTSQMMYSVPELLAALSSVCTLYPGDIVFTGTPAGVGMGRQPQRYLQPGDVVRSAISGIGEIEQRCIAAG